MPIPGLPSTTVILLDISANDYSVFELESRWRRVLAARMCPCCRTVGRFARHGAYRKYHFKIQIQILRVRCRCCGVTHALMPSFSLPGTSIGAEEAEAYLKARNEGASRAKAATALREQGMGERYPKALERMLQTAVARGKALLAQVGDARLSGLPWIVSVCGPTSRPLYEINRVGLEYGVNGLCFCRASILQFRRDRLSDQPSHDRGSVAATNMPIDSW